LKDLDLTKFIQHSEDPGVYKNDIIMENIIFKQLFIQEKLQDGCKYDLFAVVNHAGELNFGHYYSYCKIKDDWLCFNDSNVYSVLEKNVCSDNNYLLFY